MNYSDNITSSIKSTLNTVLGSFENKSNDYSYSLRVEMVREKSMLKFTLNCNRIRNELPFLFESKKIYDLESRQQSTLVNYKSDTKKDPPFFKFSFTTQAIYLNKNLKKLLTEKLISNNVRFSLSN